MAISQTPLNLTNQRFVLILTSITNRMPPTTREEISGLCWIPIATPAMNCSIIRIAGSNFPMPRRGKVLLSEASKRLIVSKICSGVIFSYASRNCLRSDCSSSLATAWTAASNALFCSPLFGDQLRMTISSNRSYSRSLEQWSGRDLTPSKAWKMLLQRGEEDKWIVRLTLGKRMQSLVGEVLSLKG